jgi:hypothetical protein
MAWQFCRRCFSGFSTLLRVFFQSLLDCLGQVYSHVLVPFEQDICNHYSLSTIAIPVSTYPASVVISDCNADVDPPG